MLIRSLFRGVESSYTDDSNTSAPPALANPSASDGANSESTEAQGADLTATDLMKSPTVAAVTSDLIDLSHLRYHLTPENRYIDIDDISEIRPGKVSPIVDGATSIEENDSLFLSIIASETILVLPLPSILVRNNLIRRFQAFLLVSPLSCCGIGQDSRLYFFIALIVDPQELCQS
jgi:hypothetical protein